jgi:hypothetical protein
MKLYENYRKINTKKILRKYEENNKKYKENYIEILRKLGY